MKCNVNRLLSLVLVLVMLVGVLPLTTKEVSAATTDVTTAEKIAFLNPVVLYEQNFEAYSADQALKGTRVTTPYGTCALQFGNAGSYDTLTAASFDEAYGISAAMYCDKTGGVKKTGSSVYSERQFYFELNHTTSQHWFTSTKAYRIEMDIYNQASAVYGGFFYLSTSTGTSAGSDNNNLNLKNYNSTTNGQWTHISFDITPSQDHARIRGYVCYSGTPTDESTTLYVDNFKVTEYTPVTDASVLATNCASEGNVVVLSADAELSSADITLASGSSLDLNGHTLTANSVDGTEGGTLIDSSEAKSGRVIVGTTDEGVDMLYPAVNNPQLPVKAADGSYALATVNLSDAYIQQTAASDEGFTLIFRPGFGTQEIVGMVGAGTSGVDMSLELTWTDVWGQSPDEPTTIKGFETVVASAYKNGKAIYAKFTNPGDTYQFVVKVNVTSSTGVTISSDVTLDADATYVNPTEAEKIYLFAHNFNNSSLGSSIEPMRGSSNITTTYQVPSYDGNAAIFDGGNTANQFNIPSYFDTESIFVIEMNLKVIETTGFGKSGESAVELVTIRHSSPSTSFKRQWPLRIGDSNATNTKNNTTLYFNKGTYTAGSDCKNTTVNTAQISTAEFTHVKLAINYATNTMTLYVDGIEIGSTEYQPTVASEKPYMYICRTGGFDHLAIDDLKIYYITPSAE